MHTFEIGRSYYTSGFNAFNSQDKSFATFTVVKRTKTQVVNQNGRRHKIMVADQDYGDLPKGTEYIQYMPGPWGSIIRATDTEMPHQGG